MKKLFFGLCSLGVIAAAVFVIYIISIESPNLKNFNERKIIQSTKIYDRAGKTLLYDVHGEEKRTIIPFEDIPRHIKNATIALEDDSFYNHFGFRPVSFLRALITNLLSGSWEQGGSTITQQLVKNTILTTEKTILRKLKEIVIAIKIERIYSKDEILNFYLNQIPYGSNAYGIEAAAETFFGKHAKDLAPLEAAYLASLPKAPSYYSPYGKHRKELDERTMFALKRMNDLGFISNKEYDDAKKQGIKFSTAKIQGIVAPHFVVEIKEELDKKFGEDVVEREGFKVITTLDVDLQQKSEEIIKKFAEINEKNFNAKNSGVIIIEPKTGDIVAMVGSRDYFDIEHDGNFNVTTAHRQPGSAFKPFVYATALKNGFTPETVVFDVPTEFNPLCTQDGQPTPGIDEDKCYHPKNFDDKFRGPVTFREALAQSLNVPSVKVLYLTGLQNALSTARDFGITSLNDPERYGLTLVLGGGEVSLLELTSAFGVFANEGVRNSYRNILTIEDMDGNVVFEAQNSPVEVIDKNIARAITDILSDNKARAPAFGEFSALYFPGKKVAAKTGTTNDYRDAWVVGYTPNFVVGVWSGNNNNASMEKRVAGFIVAPMWHEILEYIITKTPEYEFVQPEPFSQEKPWLRGEWRGGKEYIIDKISGKLATEYTPIDLRWKKVIQEVHSILYWLEKTSDPQFRNWEEQVRRWAYTNGFFDQDHSIVPNNTDDVHLPVNFPKIIEINTISKSEIYKKSDTITIIPKMESKFGVSQVDYYWGLDEEFIGSTKRSPFEMVVNIERFGEVLGETTIKIKVYDSVGNISEKYVNIDI